MKKRMAVVTLMLLLSMGLPSGQSPFESGGIRSGLKRSPHDYVAAVIELRGTIACDETKTGPRCWAHAFVVDEIASRPASKSPRVVMKVLAGRESGEEVHDRAIAFLVPIEGTDLYSGTYMSVYTRTAHERFRQAVEMAIGGTESL